MQIHINGRNVSRLDANATGVLEVQAHVDIFNPNNGVFGFIGHGIVELGFGSIFLRHSTALDPRY